MTTWELIRKMVQKGCTFEIGPHGDRCRGYWASFFVEETLPIRCWKNVGHAMTPHRAVIMAAKIALGKPVVIPGSDEFKL